MALDSQVVVKSLLAVDPRFEALCKSLFGDVVDPQAVWTYLYTPNGPAEVAKMDPTPSDVSAGGAAPKRPRVMVRNGKGGYSTLEFKDTDARANWLKNMQSQSRRKGRIRSRVGVQHPSGQVSQGVATFNTSKAVTDIDRTSVTWDVEFSKIDEDKHQVFGWASIVELNGEPVIDRQGDFISPEEIEKAAYKYVVESRKGGHQHKRDGDEPFHASDMIESIVFTDEKIAKMGLPLDFPRGWWVGYKVHDEDAWQKVKKGEVTGFSIHGRGKRQEVAA